MWLPGKNRDSNSSDQATLPSHWHRRVQGQTPGVAVGPLQVLHVQHLPPPNPTRHDWSRTQAGNQAWRHSNLSHHPPLGFEGIRRRTFGNYVALLWCFVYSTQLLRSFFKWWLLVQIIAVLDLGTTMRASLYFSRPMMNILCQVNGMPISTPEVKQHTEGHTGLGQDGKTKPNLRLASSCHHMGRQPSWIIWSQAVGGNVFWW